MTNWSSTYLYCASSLWCMFSTCRFPIAEITPRHLCLSWCLLLPLSSPHLNISMPVGVGTWSPSHSKGSLFSKDFEWDNSEDIPNYYGDIENIFHPNNIYLEHYVVICGRLRPSCRGYFYWAWVFNLKPIDLCSWANIWEGNGWDVEKQRFNRLYDLAWLSAYFIFFAITRGIWNGGVVWNLGITGFHYLDCNLNYIRW